MIGRQGTSNLFPESRVPVSVLTQGSTELPLSAYSPGAVIIFLDASTTPADFSQEVTQTLFLWDWHLPHVRSCKSATDCLGYYREVSGVIVWWSFFRSAGAHHRLFMILRNSQHLQSFNGIFFSHFSSSVSFWSNLESKNTCTTTSTFQCMKGGCGNYYICDFHHFHHVGFWCRERWESESLSHLSPLSHVCVMLRYVILESFPFLLDCFFLPLVRNIRRVMEFLGFRGSFFGLARMMNMFFEIWNMLYHLYWNCSGSGPVCFVRAIPWISVFHTIRVIY